MSTADRILIVDDEELFRDTFRDVLLREGYLVDTAADRASALNQLDSNQYSAVLIDQKLQGSLGPDSGLDMISETLQRAPGAKAFIVTGYPSPEGIQRAFEAGIYDYLVKDEYFEEFLRAKLRNALEVSRERRLANMEREGREAELRSLWQQTQSEPDRNRKGKLLEDTMRVLFSLIPGLTPSIMPRRNRVEEIDIVIRNESRDPFWQKEQQYWLVECKNWSKPVGADEVRGFLWKLFHRYGRCGLGFFIAPQGITKPVRDELGQLASTDKLVIVMDGQDLDTLIVSSDHGAMLKSLHERAMLAR